MEVRKEIIRPGTYTYLHPRTGQPEKLTVTQDTIKHFAVQGAAMIKAGLSIPVPVEHQPDARPMTDSERAAGQLRNNAGWVKGYEVSGDRLIGVLDIQDAEIAKKLPHTIKFTSPWINSFTSGAGVKYDGVISHVALTTRPRITAQEPFAADMAAALSMVGRLSDHQFAPKLIGQDGFALSEAGLLRKDQGGALRPEYPMAFSLMSGVRLSKEEIKEMVEEEEVAEGEKPAAKEGEVGTDGHVSPLDDVGDVGPKDVTIHETIGHLLKALGFHPPDGMDEATFERDLYETLMAKVQELGAKGAQDTAAAEKDPAASDGPGVKTGNNPVIQESPAMYASLAEINQIENPRERKLAGALFSLQQEALNTAAKARDQKLQGVLKRLPQKRRDDLVRLMAAPGASLSMNDDGKVVDPMNAMLDILDAGLPSLGAVTPTIMPQPEDGTFTEERRQQVIGEYSRNVGGQMAPAKSA